MLRFRATRPQCFQGKRYLSDVQRLTRIRDKKGFIVDMDGVVYRGSHLLPGVQNFIQWANESHKKLLFLTNTSTCSAERLQLKVQQMGLKIPINSFVTSSMATASFIQTQHPQATAFVVGEQNLHDELTRVGIQVINSSLSPSCDYVVFGESGNYSHNDIALAINYVQKGASLIGTNCDHSDPIEDGNLAPSCGAWISVIEKATKVDAYFIGKPNPLILRYAQALLGLANTDCAVIGDRMDTDIRCGVEGSIDTVLVFSGITKKSDLEGNKYGWKPFLVLDKLGDIVPS